MHNSWNYAEITQAHFEFFLSHYIVSQAIFDEKLRKLSFCGRYLEPTDINTKALTNCWLENYNWWDKVIFCKHFDLSLKYDFWRIEVKKNIVFRHLVTYFVALLWEIRNWRVTIKFTSQIMYRQHLMWEI